MAGWQCPSTESSFHEEVLDCSDVKNVDVIDLDMVTQGGYQYNSTAVVREFWDGI